MNSGIDWPFIWFFSGVQLFSSAVQPRALLKCLQFLYPQNQNLWEQKPGIHIFTKLPRWLWCSPLIKNTMCFLYSKTHFLNYIARNFKLMLTVFLWSPPPNFVIAQVFFLFFWINLYVLSPCYMIGTVLSGLHGFFHLQLNCSMRLNSLSPFDRPNCRTVYTQGHTTCWCWRQDSNSARAVWL